MTSDELLALAREAKDHPYRFITDGMVIIRLADGIIAQAAEIERLKRQALDSAEDWALAGIAPNSEMAAKLTEHYRQREADRQELERLRQEVQHG